MINMVDEQIDLGDGYVCGANLHFQDYELFYNARGVACIDKDGKITTVLGVDVKKVKKFIEEYEKSLLALS